MNKLRAVFCYTIMTLSCTMNANADDRYAHEYYSDSDDERRDRDHRHDNHEHESERSEKRAIQMPRYQQDYQQPPIQIYMQPPQQQFRQNDFRQHDKQFRDDRRWRERREELERMPQTPYLENQFERDDTHW
ncbi:MAG: hypothetical protein WCI06_10465 [Methylococcaceae bacterium]